MGMFDSILAHESLIYPLVSQYGFELPMSKDKEYFYFQTKDLDNFLTNFFIDADGSFSWEKRHQEYIEPTEEEKKKSKFAFGHWKETAPIEKIEDTRTAYIEFYDVFNHEEERIFITFLAHVKKGKLVEPISIKSIERTDLKKEAEETKICQEKWKNVRGTWEWKLCDFYSKIKWKITRFFLPLSKGIDNIEKSLRKKAREKYLDEKDIGNW